MEMFDVMFTVIPIIVLLIFVLTILMIIIMIIPKFRSKIFGAYLKSTKHILDENSDTLKGIYDIDAEIKSDSITKKSSAEARGLTQELIKMKKELSKEKDESSFDNYCKYCGAKVDLDSKYCSKCGKKI